MKQFFIYDRGISEKSFFQVFTSFLYVVVFPLAKQISDLMVNFTASLVLKMTQRNARVHAVYTSHNNTCTCTLPSDFSVRPGPSDL